MEELKTKAEQLTHHVGELLETYYRLTLVNVTEKATRAATGSFNIALAGIFCICILMFTGIGLSVWLGEILNNAAAGYFLTGAIYLVLLAVLYFLRKKLFFPYIRDYIVRKIKL